MSWVLQNSASSCEMKRRVSQKNVFESSRPTPQHARSKCWSRFVNLHEFANVCNLIFTCSHSSTQLKLCWSYYFSKRIFKFWIIVVWISARSTVNYWIRHTNSKKKISIWSLFDFCLKKIQRGSIRSPCCLPIW